MFTAVGIRVMRCSEVFVVISMKPALLTRSLIFEPDQIEGIYNKGQVAVLTGYAYNLLDELDLGYGVVVAAPP